jgi:hypothetical protein
MLHYVATQNGRCVKLAGNSMLVDYPMTHVFPYSEKCEGFNSTHLAYPPVCSGGYFATAGGETSLLVSLGLPTVIDNIPSFSYRWSSLMEGPPVPNSNGNALSTGAIAGIAVGSLAFVAAIVALLYVFVFGATKSAMATTVDEDKDKA